MSDQEKNLKLMRFWLIGAFFIIFVAATVYVGSALNVGFEILTTFNYWLAVIIGGALCVVWYYIYKWYLGRK